jgi:hypothetical protein
VLIAALVALLVFQFSEDNLPSSGEILYLFRRKLITLQKVLLVVSFTTLTALFNKSEQLKQKQLIIQIRNHKDNGRQ